MGRLPAAGLLLLFAACAAKAPPRPTGPVTPDPSAAERFQSATSQCRGLRTLTAELALSGRAGGERLRGRVVAGLERVGRRASKASRRLARPSSSWPPPTSARACCCRAIAACSTTPPCRPCSNGSPASPLAPTTFVSCSRAASWSRPIRLRDGGGAAGGRPCAVAPERVAYMRERQGTVVVVAADYGPWRVDYAGHAGGWPRSVRVRRGGDTTTDVTARLSQLEINVPIDPRAFTLDVSPGMTPMTLDELRSVAPLAPKAP